MRRLLPWSGKISRVSTIANLVGRKRSRRISQHEVGRGGGMEREVAGHEDVWMRRGCRRDEGGKAAIK